MKTKIRSVDLSSMSREELEQNYIEVKARIAELENENEHLLSMIRRQRAEKFGPSSEKNIYDADQISFFDEAEKEASETLEEIEAADPAFTTAAAASGKKKKAKNTKKKSFGKLPVEEIKYELPTEEQICPVCGTRLRKMKTTVREELVLIPAKIVRRRHIQQHYVCDKCQKAEGGVPVISAPAPAPLFKGGSWATPSFVANTIVMKYLEAVPLDRQAQGYRRQGMRISKQTLSNQLLRTRERYLTHIYEILHKNLIRHDIIHADETECEVLHEPGRKATQKSWIWLFRTGAREDQQIVLYQYADTRARCVPEEFLRNTFSGYLQSDAYAAYRSLAKNSTDENKIISVACLAHLRRKWTDARKGLPENKRDDPNTNIARGILYCDKMFETERQIQELPVRQIQSAREEKLRPLMLEYFAWVEKLYPDTAKSDLQDALRYSINQQEYMLNVFCDPRLALTNSIAERSIKPFVIGRKNFLFFNTPRGADASAEIYSIVETAKANGLDPYRYIIHILETISQIKNPTEEDYQKQLPFRELMPKECSADYFE